MRALVVYCHPKETSFTAAVRDVVLDRLRAAGAEVRLRDLYARRVRPAAHRPRSRHLRGRGRERRAHAPRSRTCAGATRLIFVYPTWWYGLPAMLKGWLDRVLCRAWPS
jgi:NAD(P)H dehydrogenase (quinone)